MPGGPLFPSSIYLGGASGFLFSYPYVPATNTNNAGVIEGVGCVASPSTGVFPAVLQFNLPGSIPTGTMKLRTLMWSTATANNATLLLNDCVTQVGANIGASTLIVGSSLTLSPAGADLINENKSALQSTAIANSILTVRVDFNNSTSQFNLTAPSAYQFSVVWE